MSRKSPTPPVFTSRRIWWAIFRQFCQWMPGLGKTFNFPVKRSCASDFASTVLEDEVQELALAPEDLEQARSILMSSMAKDAGDTSTYPTGRSKLRSKAFKIDHCVVTGHTMMVLDISGASVLDQVTGPMTCDQAQPTLLKHRRAPTGTFYTLTCRGHFDRFFASDVISLLYFLRRHGQDIGPLHIVTNPEFPPFVEQSLRAICLAYGNVTILELEKSERLVDVSALWLSRCPDAKEWTPVTRNEADELGHLLSDYHQLPAASAPKSLLFVSRGDAKLRRLLNEAELMAELMDFDFEFFLPKSDNHKAQIEAFRSARIVVAVHGAALTNLVFCQPGALIIELFPSNQIKSTYCWLAMRMGLRYRAVVGFSGDALQAFATKIPLVIAEVEAELEGDQGAILPEPGAEERPKP